MFGKIVKVSKTKVKVKFDYPVDGEKVKEYPIDSVSLIDRPGKPKDDESDAENDDDEEPLLTSKSMKAKMAKAGAVARGRKLSVKGSSKSSSEEPPMKKTKSAVDAEVELPAAEVVPEKTPAAETPAVDVEAPPAAVKTIDLSSLFGGKMID